MNTRKSGIWRMVVVVAAIMLALFVQARPAMAFCNRCGTCQPCSLKAQALNDKAVAAEQTGPETPASPQTLQEQTPAISGPEAVWIGGASVNMIKVTWGTDAKSSALLTRCFRETSPSSNVYQGDSSEGLPGAGSITYAPGGGDNTYVWHAGNDLTLRFNAHADAEHRYVQTEDATGKVIHKSIRGSSGEIVGWSPGDGVPSVYTETPGSSPARPSLVEHSLDSTVVEKTYYNYNRWPRRKRQTVERYGSDGSRQFATTIEVYYSSTHADVNKRGRPWYVVQPEGVSRYLGTNGYAKGINPSSPGSNCDLDDWATVPDDGATGLLAYADTIYTGYDSQGRVTGYSSCGSCGGGGSYTYQYLDDSNPAYPSSPSEDQKFNLWKSARRITEPSGLRRVEFLNAQNQLVCEVVQEMSGTTIVNRWLTHNKYDTSGRVVERREVSACPISVSPDAARYYLQAVGGWTTSVTVPTTESSAAGISRLYAFDANGNLTHEKIRQGLGGSVYFLRKYTYTSRTAGGRTVYHLASETSYPTQTVSETPDPDDRLTTSYSYTFRDGSLMMASRTVTYPAVSAGKNGSGSATGVTYNYRWDSANNLNWNDWTRHEDGTYSYTGLGTGTYNHGKTVTSIQDANSSGTGAANFPDGWTTRSEGLHLRTTYGYYGDASETGSLGQIKTVTFDPGGSNERRSVTAYMSSRRTAGGKETTTALVTLSTPYISGNDYSLLPMSVNVSDMSGRSVISFTGAADSPADGDLTNDWDATDTDVQAAFKTGDAGQATIHTMTVNTFDGHGKLASSDRYHVIPASGYGSSGTNYYRTSYTYDSVTGRQYKTTGPDGTVSYSVVDKLGRPASTWVGTNDTGGTADNPAGSGAPNNMVKLSETHYDGATAHGVLAIGDGNVTLSRVFHGDGASYDTVYAYDWRNRQTASRGPDKMAALRTLDNLGRACVVETFHDADADLALDDGEVRTCSRTYYDEKGQVYQTRSYKQKTSAHAEGDDRMTVGYWYDSRGRQIKSRGPTGLFSKTVYDSAGRGVASYTCYDDSESSYADAATVAGDTVIEQSNTVYDAAGNVLLTTSFQRTDSTAKTGDLSDSWAAADSRRTYVAYWYDAAGRSTRAASYGDNGGSALTRPGAAVEPNTSDDCIVTKFEYNSAGRQYKTTDNLAKATVREFDALGRTVTQIENCIGDGIVTETDTDANRTTVWQYDTAGRLFKLIARNPKGAGNGIEDQETKYYYGTTVSAASPAVYRNDVLAAVVYPDSDNAYSYSTSSWSGTYDRVEYTYDRMGRKVTSKDQRGIVHAYVFDTVTGRLKANKVTSDPWPTGVDDYVKSITYKHDNLGRLARITSHGNVTDDPDDTASVRNQVLYHDDSNPGFDDWGNLKQSWQAHSGAVNTATSPKVGYYYEESVASGEVAYVRPDYVAYPGAGRSVYYNYSASGVGGKLSRLDNLADDGSGTTKYAQYTYLGGGTIVQVAHPAVPGWLKLTVSGSAGSIAVGADVYEFNSGTLGDGRGKLMAKDSTHWYIRSTAGTWADSARVSSSDSDPDTNNADYSAKADTDGLTLTYGSGGTYGGFDRFGRVVDQKWTKSAGPIIDRVEYGYDRASNRVWRDVGRELPAAPAGKDEFYTYDNLHRLATADRGDLTGTPYSGVTNVNFRQQWHKTESGTPVAELDSLGNWRKFRQATDGTSFTGSADLTQTRTSNAVNELTGFGALADPPTPAQAAWVAPVYDAAGNMTSGPKPGELADGETRLHFVYDAWNRLVAVWQDDGDGTLETGGQAGDDSVVGQYQYDGRNYRIVKLVPHGGPAIAPTTWDRTDFYYNENWQVLEERFAANIPSPAGGGQGEGATITHVQWLWDVRYIDAPVLRWRDADADPQTGAGGLEETLYYANDANMNVTALVDAATGGVVERYIYDPYGKATIYDSDWSAEVAWANSRKNTVTYCGYHLEAEADLYHARNRYYHSGGVWLWRDPAGYIDGKNVYAYSRSMPLSHTDPFGLAAESKKGCGCCYYSCTGTYAITIKGQKQDNSDTQAQVTWKVSVSATSCYHKRSEKCPDVKLLVPREWVRVQGRSDQWWAGERLLEASFWQGIRATGQGHVSEYDKNTLYRVQWGTGIRTNISAELPEDATLACDSLLEQPDKTFACQRPISTWVERSNWEVSGYTGVYDCAEKIVADASKLYEVLSVGGLKVPSIAIGYGIGKGAQAAIAAAWCAAKIRVLDVIFVGEDAPPCSGEIRDPYITKGFVNK